MRRAVAAASVLTFLVLVSIALFTSGGNGADDGVAADLVKDLRWVVIIVVGFYFANDSVRSFLAARYRNRRVARPADNDDLGGVTAHPAWPALRLRRLPSI